MQTSIFYQLLHTLFPCEISRQKLTFPLNCLAAVLSSSRVASAFSSSWAKKARRWDLMLPPKIFGAVYREKEVLA